MPEEKRASTVLYNNLIQLKKMVSPDSFRNLGDMVMEKIFQLNPDTGFLPPSTFSKTVNKYVGASGYGRNVLQVFDFPKGKLESVQELAKVAGAVSASQRLAAPGSITPPNQITWGTAKMILADPIKGTARAITFPMLAKLWYSDMGMKYLTNGLRLPEGSTQGVDTAVKILGILNSDDKNSLNKMR
jgi:hypothetical protein